MMKLLAVVMALAACGNGDKCSKVFDKLQPAFEKEAKGVKMDRAKEIDRCKQQIKDHPEREKEMDCILAISGTPTMGDLMACSEKQKGEKPADKSKPIEAKLQLDRIGKDAKRIYAETSKFPVGSAPLTPATDCCKGEGGKCQPDPKAWTAGPWAAMEFTIDEPHLFRYSYESTDGTTFTATAVGDLDCSGRPQTFTLKGSVDAGNPKVELQEPTN
ncbi:MAG: hypothetical protein ABJE66_37600 [Deltaproteobacteria bacterium]